MSIIVDTVNFTDKTFNKGTKSHLIGGVGRLIEKYIELHIYAEAQAGENDTENDIDERFTLTKQNPIYGYKTTLERVQGSFLVDGFVDGDEVYLQDSTTTEFLSIKSVDEALIVFNEVSANFSDSVSSTMLLSLLSGQYSAIEVVTAFNTNSDEAAISPIDNTSPRFIGNLGGVLEAAGMMSGYIPPRSGYVQLATYISDSTQIGIKLYQHIGPFFEDYTQCDGDFPSFFLESECINWYTRIRLLKNINNPNEYREVLVPDTTANTGWTGENYNQGQNPYSVEDVVFKNFPGNKEISGIQLDKPTQITFKLKSAGIFEVDMPLQACFSTILEGDGHKENLETYTENAYFENATFAAVGSGPGNGVGTKFTLDGEGMKWVRGDFIDSSTINVTIQFYPGAALRNTVINEQRKLFQLWVNTELFSESDIYNTKEVPVPIACGNLITDPNLDSLLRLGPWGFYEHDEIITGESKTSYAGYLTDDIFAVQNIGLRDLLAEITNIKIGIYASYSDRGGSGEFPLEEYEFKTEGQSLDDISASISRGYLLEASDNHNRVQVLRNSDLDGEFYYLKVIYAWRIRYEDWVKKANVPTRFYDTTELNDGYHEKWNVYDDKAKIYFRSQVTIKSKETGGTNTETIQTQLLFGNYGEAMDNDLTWSDPTQKTFKADGTTEISDNVQRNDITVMQYDFVSSAAHGGVANYYGECKAENYQDGILSIYEISTVKDPITGMLIPNTGQTKAQLTEVDSTTLRLSFSVDPDFINKSQVSFYPRIGRLSKPVSWTVHNIQNFDAAFDVTVKVHVLLTDTIMEDSHPILTGGTGHGTIIGTGAFTIADFSGCDLSEWSDFTRLTGLTILNCEDQINLKQVFLPMSTVRDLRFKGCDLQEVDLTMTDADVTGSTWEFYDNVNLQFIEFNPTTAGTVDTLDCHNCDLEYIDLTPIVQFGITIDLSDNHMTQEEVDLILVDLDNSLTTNGTITIDGTNEAPGALGLAAKTSLEGKSWTVTVTT